MFIDTVVKIEYVRQGYLPNYPYHLISEEELMDAFLRYQIKVDKELANKVIQGDKTLWEAPRSYVSLYGLSSSEYVDEDDSQYLIISGNKQKMENFLQLSGLNVDCTMSPDCYFYNNYPLLYDSLQEAYNTLVEAICYHIHVYLTSLTDTAVVRLPDWVYSYMIGSVISVNSSQADIHDLLVLLNLDNIDDEFNEKIFTSCKEISEKWISKLPPSKNDHRPPTIFGEPHVIKSLRISGLLADDEES